MYYYFYHYSHSAAPNLQVSSQTASSVLESVTGHSDWEFLKPDRQSSASSTSSSASASHSSSSSETTLAKDVRKPRHPMLEDFDGEIAVFQVNGHFSIIICIYYYFYNVLLAIIMHGTALHVKHNVLVHFTCFNTLLCNTSLSHLPPMKDMYSQLIFVHAHVYM